ncbi:MAG: hypothetical protein JJ924_01050 [Roseitalea sp.]|nr:hypothetical protein [Roseitalea sp.]MBO6731348.1 hypothetical protein [Roseitalea sp.]MBO6925058.1 hypothetical protein [Roseitalea sp.]RNC95911.1 MAG: hypothetical protein ED558_07065 [Oricola sp.]
MMILPEWIALFRLATGIVKSGLVLLALVGGFSTLPAAAGSGTYVPYSGIVRGTEGADPVEVSVANETGAPIDCQASLAHWYSDELGRIAPGGELTLTLWHDRQTGALNLLNTIGDRMPVEAVWCASGTARTRLKLPMAAGGSQAAFHFACHARDDQGLRCDALDG